MRFVKTVFSFLLLITALNASARTQARTDDVISVPSISAEDLGRASQNIYATPPSLTLIPHSPQAHRGNLWLRSTDDGLHVWGKVEADEQGFHWPQQKSEMLSSDHIEVWLAASAEVPTPKIGWGNQFGTTELDSPKDCAGQTDPHTGDAESGVKNCERWYGEQVQYRHYLQRLFVRQWLVAGSPYSSQTYWFEDFASTGYADLVANFFPDDLPQVLQPKSDDGLSVEIGSEVRPDTRQNAAGTTEAYNRQTGYHFHLFIPYKAFPPTQQLTLSDLRLMVDVFSAAPAGRKMGEYSSSAAERRWGQTASFNRLSLTSPRTFSLTPCNFTPEQRDLYDKSYPAWFFPTQSGEESGLRSTFALMNPSGGYMYAPASVSPEVVQSKYFWKQVTKDAIVCGPLLTWRSGKTITRTKFATDEEHLEAKALPDGWNLLRSGPLTSTLSPFGSGQCGSCLVMSFDIFAVSPQGEIVSALSIHDDLTGSEGQPSADDLTIAPDWAQIIVYRMITDPRQTETTTGWTSTTYCLAGHAYKQCGESKQANPPDPPHFKELRTED